MMANILIIRGADSTDDLGPMGLPVAHAYAEASTVVLVGSAGATFAKGSGDFTRARFIDAASSNGVLIECMDRVKTEWEQRAPDGPVDGYSHAGFWLYFWTDGPEATTMPTLLALGKHDDLRRAAGEYVEYALAALMENLMEEALHADQTPA